MISLQNRSLGVLLLEPVARDVVADQVDDEAARADAGVEHLHARLGERRAEFAPQHLLDAVAHEVHDLLRRVDDAVRVGLLDREALEEALVDGVEEVLLLRPVIQVARGVLDGEVEAVQRPEELLAVEGAAASAPG